jgi:hypothetical protein
MAIRGVILANSTALGAFTGSSVTWNGGRGTLVLNAAQYGASVLLQVQNFTGTWVPMNTTTFSVDQAVAFDIPPGQIRMLSTGSSAGMVATLCEVPYT